MSPNRSFIPSGSAALLATGVALITVAGQLHAQPGSQANQGRLKPPVPERIHVDTARGNDRNPGTGGRPLKSVSAAVALLPELLTRSVTIEVTGGSYGSTGGHDMAGNCLELMRRMRPQVEVRIVGRPNRQGQQPTLTWEGGPAMVDVREGDWWLENVQIGSGSTRQHAVSW